MSTNGNTEALPSPPTEQQPTDTPTEGVEVQPAAIATDDGAAEVVGSNVPGLVATPQGEAVPAGIAETKADPPSADETAEAAVVKPQDAEIEEDMVIVSKEDANSDSVANDELNEDDDNLKLRDEEQSLIGGEILFPRDVPPSEFSGWDSLRWMSHAGIRKVRYCADVYKQCAPAEKGFNLFGFGSTGSPQYRYVPRKLSIYAEPNLILLLRKPTGNEELRKLLDLGPDDVLETSSEYLVVEAVCDPETCKLRLSPLTTPTSVTENDDETADARRRSCFELLTPRGNIILSALSSSSQSFTDSGAFMETTTAELAISKSLCEGHSANDDTGTVWHQIILGSLHSYVILGSTRLLEKSIATAMKRSPEDVVRKGSLEFLHGRLVDPLDHLGNAPLHLACRGGVAATVGATLVSILIKAGARVDITDREGWAPIHLCALHLDYKSLSIVLATDYPARPDPNLPDPFGRTPMYVAAIDGRTPGGEKDPAALGRCIMALDAWGGRMILDPTSSKIRWPQCELAAEFRQDDLAQLFDHSSFRYSLPSNMMGPEQVGMSVGAFYHYPLHCALIALLRDTQALYEEISGMLVGAYEKAAESKVVRTVRTLLEHGFEPNERLDSLEGFSGRAIEYEEFIGYSPLQILAAVALEADNLRERIDGHDLVWVMKVISQTAHMLVRFGARLSLDAPPAKRTISNGDSSSSSLVADGPIIDAYDRSSLSIQSNKQLLFLLGGSEELNAAKKLWQEAKVVEATSKIPLLREHDDSFVERNVPGGSSEKSCAICWSEFGSIMNRRHWCRVSHRFVCDECSAKRLAKDGQHRISDGQFNLARIDLRNEAADQAQMQAEQNRLTMQKMEEAHAATRQQRLDDTANRDSLFGRVMEKAESLFSEEDAAASTERQVEGLADTLGNTRNALLDRGQKLDSLSDKTAQMVDASADFAKLAKELKRQSEGGFFW